MTAALRSGAFPRLAALYVCNSVLEWFGSVAMMVIVYEATGSAFAAALLLVAKQVIPGLAMPFVGSALDRSDLPRVLIATFAINGLVLGAIGLLGYGPLMFVLAALAGTCGAIGRASLRGAVARVLTGDAFRQGNATLNMLMGVIAPIAPALAAFVVAVSHASSALLIAAVVLLGVSPLALRLRLTSAQGDEHVEEEVEEGKHAETPMRGSRSTPLWGVLSLAAVITFAFSMDDPALMGFSEEALHSGVSGFGAIYTAGGIGITLGSVLFTRLIGWPMLRIYVLATALSGVAYLGMGVSPSIEVACLFAMLGGIGAGMDWVAIATAVQEAAGRGHEVRAAARLEAIAMIAPGAGYLAGGLVAGALGPRAALLLPGLIALAALAAVALFIATPRWRTGSRGATPAPTIFSASLPGGST
ncbi:MAG: MFS transporter [Thermoleophilaceae bacterium]|nr:MFS transporter [Thermoleophilaceae bacterium]